MTFRIGTPFRHKETRNLIVSLACACLSACGGASSVSEDANVVADTGVEAGRDTGNEMRDAPAVDAGGDAAIEARSYGRGVSVGSLRGVPETSGIVASRAYPGVLWVHNDSGNAAELIAIDDTATVLETMRVDGARNNDWEDITLAHDPDRGDVIYIGDIGDNVARESMGASSSRGGVMRIYRVVEPNPRGTFTHIPAESFDLRYPARPYDCEAMFADPRTGDLYFVTKDETADVFVAHAPFAADSVTTLEHVTSFPILTATAADMSADGARLVVRNYGEIRVYDVSATEPRIANTFGSTPALLPYTAFAEAICFSAADYDLYTISEGNGAPLFHIPFE